MKKLAEAFIGIDAAKARNAVAVADEPIDTGDEARAFAGSLWGPLGESRAERVLEEPRGADPRAVLGWTGVVWGSSNSALIVSNTVPSRADRFAPRSARVAATLRGSNGCAATQPSRAKWRSMAAATGRRGVSTEEIERDRVDLVLVRLIERTQRVAISQPAGVQELATDLAVA